MTTQIEVTAVGAHSTYDNVQVEQGPVVVSVTLTPSGSNQATAFTAAQLAGPSPLFVTLNADENIFFAIGVAPDATVAGARRALGAGMRTSFAYNAGWQVAVVSR